MEFSSHLFLNAKTNDKLHQIHENDKIDMYNACLKRFGSNNNNLMDSNCFRKILANRAQLDPVPLWKLLEGSTNMPNLTIRSTYKRTKSHYRFSISSGLSDHTINAFQLEALSLEKEDKLSGVMEINMEMNSSSEGDDDILDENEIMASPAKRKIVNTTITSSINTSGSPLKNILNENNSSTPTTPTSASQRAIRRDSRLLSTEMISEYLSEDEIVEDTNGRTKLNPSPHIVNDSSNNSNTSNTSISSTISTNK